jgi:hypothetical protein
MTRPFKGSLSGVYFDIPELDDPADIEAAFANFADTIPASPVVMTTKTVRADVNPAEPNTLYVFEGSAPHTVFLAPGQADADKISILQLQNDPITVNPNGVNFQGPTATSTQFSALTIMWQAAEGRWVGSPFFSSGVLPPASIGGEIVDLLGRRYHVFRNPGQEFFYAHKDMTVDVLLVGPGGDGAPQGALAGDGGRGGQVVTGQAHVDLMQSFPVAVGANGFPSVFRSLTAAPGADGVVDTVTPVDAPYSLPADIAQVLGYTTVGGSGQADSGPVTPSTYGKGGSGAYKMLTPVARPYTLINHAGSPGSPGTPGTPDQRICVGANPTYGTEPVQGANQTPYCPATWSYAHTDCSGVWCKHSDGRFERNGWLGGCPAEGGWWGCNCGACCTNQQVQTGWNCDGRAGSLDGSQCCYTQPGTPGTPGTPSTPGWTETRYEACPSGYTESNTMCVDPRSAGPGQGGDGVGVVSYVWP